MSFAINVKYDRPSVDVAWPHTCPWLTPEQNAEKEQYWQDTYITPGLVVDRTFTHSGDQLSLEVTTVFKDRAAFDTFVRDTRWKDWNFTPRALYMDENNIKMEYMPSATI